MSDLILYLAIAFIACLGLKDVFFICIFSIVFFIFLFLRYHSFFWNFIWILCTIVACCVVQDIEVEPIKGNYEVIEIKKGYAIAKNEDTSILLYNVDECNYGQIYYVSSFEKIHSLKNITLFSFEDYMAKQHIYYSANNPSYVSKNQNIRQILYSRCSDSDILLQNLYGIYSDDTDMISRLGLPIISLLYFIKRCIKKHFNERNSHIIVLFLAICFGYCFVYTIPLLRFIFVHFSKLITKDRKKSLGLTMIIFGCFKHEYVLDFSFVFPIVVSIIQCYVPKSLKQTLYVRYALFVCSLMYFHQINVWTFLFFGWLRKIYMWIFVLELFRFHLYEHWIQLVSKLPDLTYIFVPSILFYLFVFLFLRTKKRRYIFVMTMIFLFQSKIDPFFHIYMLDIGQGDCTVIVEPFQKSVVMIDCGQNLYRDNVKDVVVPFLQNQGIRKIDSIIVTHDDFDHSGGVEELCNMIEVKEVIRDSSQVIDVGYPFYSLLTQREAKDENDQSIISLFSYDDYSYLWMGDASVDIESQILETYNLDVDVLKLGHHGSNTSSSYEFLDTIRPSLGLVSVGYNNKYNHPSDEVIATCHDLGIHILETKDVGMIHIFSFKNFRFFETATKLIGRLL